MGGHKTFCRCIFSFLILTTATDLYIVLVKCFLSFIYLHSCTIFINKAKKKTILITSKRPVETICLFVLCFFLFTRNIDRHGVMMRK